MTHMYQIKVFSSLIYLTIVVTLLLPNTSNAQEYELTPYLGQMFSDTLISNDENIDIPVSDDLHLGLALAWKASSTGQGQVLINYTRHNFKNDIQQQSTVDVLYSHFSGVALFGNRGYTTTLAIGFGGTYIKSDNSGALYPSATVALGTRYKLSDNLSFVTELRAYATLISDGDNLFCQNDVCLAQFNSAFWLETSISAGLAYRF